MGAENLDELFEIVGRESVYAARNRVRAMRAEKDGDPDAARMFKSLALAQENRARRAALLARGSVSGPEADLEAASVETGRAVEAMTAAEQIAEARGLEGAASALNQFKRAAMGQGARLAGIAKTSGLDYPVCTICGFLALGPVPEKCPICGAVSGRFETPKP